MEEGKTFNRERRRVWLDLKNQVLLASTIGWNSKPKAEMRFQKGEQQSQTP
jgi:hypothetical protein